jgi:hypothetical protein
MASLVYGYMGGPLELAGISWYTMSLGGILWAIASVWALITVHNVNSEQCPPKSNPVCGKISSKLDETDPLDEIRKAH